MLARVQLADFSHVSFVDERPRPREQLRNWRVGVGNLVETLSRVNLPDATHWFLKAVRITGGSALDGSYGLGLSPDRRFLLSAHRGLNEVIVYRYPELRVHTRCISADACVLQAPRAVRRHAARLHHATIKEPV